jgi:hypothetical protein
MHQQQLLANEVVVEIADNEVVHLSLGRTINGLHNSAAIEAVQSVTRL